MLALAVADSFFAPFRATLRHLDAVRWQKNSALDWIYAGGTLVLSWIVFRVAHAFLAKYLRKVATRTQTPLDDVLFEVVEGTRWFFHAAIAITLARQWLDLPKNVTTIVNGFVAVALFVQAGIWLERVLSGVTRYWANKQEGGHNATVAAGVRFVLQILIWAVIALLILSNLGIQISALIAGLGVGGIAAALALQSLLGDVFAGLSMYFDRPFDIGDFIVVDDMKGTVTRIGLRSTRIRSLDGEEIVVPNGDLVKGRIHNFARQKERRVVFGFGVDYETPTPLLRRAVQVVRDAISSEPHVRLDRAHFKGFTQNALEFEAVYFVDTPSFNTYMDVQQEMNFKIYEALEDAGITFAFTYAKAPRVPKDAPPPGQRARNEPSNRDDEDRASSDSGLRKTGS